MITLPKWFFWLALISFALNIVFILYSYHLICLCALGGDAVI